MEEHEVYTGAKRQGRGSCSQARTNIGPWVHCEYCEEFEVITMIGSLNDC